MYVNIFVYVHMYVVSVPCVLCKLLFIHILHIYACIGAGEAGVGIANLIASSIQKEEGLTEEQARGHIWLYDSKGVVHADRADAKSLVHHKAIYAHKLPTSDPVGSDLLSVVKAVKPTALIGVSAQGGVFTEGVCREMAAISEAPLILPLSNPTSKAECTAAQAYGWTDGRAVVFTGSPFEPVILPDGRKVVPGQGNNAYIFPAVGLGAVASGALTIADEEFTVAAETLASLVGDEQLSQGTCYPPLKDIRHVSLKIAAAVAKSIIKNGRGDSSLVNLSDAEIEKRCKDMMYEAKYD